MFDKKGMLNKLGGFKMSFRKIVVLAVFFLILPFAGFGQSSTYAPWLKVKASYQAVFTSDLADVSGFQMDRARIGASGSFLNNLYFEIIFEGKYTQDDSGTELKKAFVSWEYIKGHKLNVGGVQIAFTRPISGTEFAFISYDLTSSPHAYQYGIVAEGSINSMFSYSAGVVNGEGMTSDNIGNGFLYTARVEATPFGQKDLRDGSPELKKEASLTISAAAALDNKSKTDDFGVTYQYYNSYHFLVDVMFKVDALSLFAQGNYNSYDQLEDGGYWGGIDHNAKSSYGGFAQVSYNLINTTGIALEPVVRFDYWREVTQDYSETNVDKSQILVGASLYLKGHSLKINGEFRRVLSDNRFYGSLKAPSDNFFGVRITHKFGSGKIGL